MIMIYLFHKLFETQGDNLASIDIVNYSGHVRPELSLLNWFKTIDGNIVNKLATVGLVRTEATVEA